MEDPHLNSSSQSRAGGSANVIYPPRGEDEQMLAAGAPPLPQDSLLSDSHLFLQTRHFIFSSFVWETFAFPSVDSNFQAKSRTAGPAGGSSEAQGGIGGLAGPAGPEFLNVLTS